MKKQTSTPGDKSVEPSASRDAEIQARAYQLYEQGGRRDGHDKEDWLQAEQLLSNQQIVRPPEADIDRAVVAEPAAVGVIDVLKDPQPPRARAITSPAIGGTTRQSIRTHQPHPAARKTH